MRTNSVEPASNGRPDYIETSVVVLGAIYGLFLLAVLAINVAVL
jgi:hypothetical protein